MAYYSKQDHELIDQIHRKFDNISLVSANRLCRGKTVIEKEGLVGVNNGGKLTNNKIGKLILETVNNYFKRIHKTQYSITLVNDRYIIRSLINELWYI